MSASQQYWRLCWRGPARTLRRRAGTIEKHGEGGRPRDAGFLPATLDGQLVYKCGTKAGGWKEPRLNLMRNTERERTSSGGWAGKDPATRGCSPSTSWASRVAGRNPASRGAPSLPMFLNSSSTPPEGACWSTLAWTGSSTPAEAPVLL